MNFLMGNGRLRHRHGLVNGLVNALVHLVRSACLVRSASLVRLARLLARLLRSVATPERFPVRNFCYADGYPTLKFAPCPPSVIVRLLNSEPRRGVQPAR